MWTELEAVALHHTHGAGDPKPCLHKSQSSWDSKHNTKVTRVTENRHGRGSLERAWLLQQSSPEMARRPEWVDSEI